MDLSVAKERKMFLGYLLGQEWFKEHSNNFGDKFVNKVVEGDRPTVIKR